ncbi:FabG Dehydrogenases with different specificities (related to short-chain alcohol dehydrogenases) [Rhabdaerophilaceae bacterium]
MPDRLKGRVALVTGAAQGIGQAIARTLRAAGAVVHVTDREKTRLARFVAAEGFSSHAADLGDRQAVSALIGEVIAESRRLDILVNAAGGVCGQVGGPIESVTEEAWRTVFAANVDSAFWLAQAGAPHLKDSGNGRIVFIASGAGLRPSLTGIQAYTAAKHALVGLTKQLSQDLGPFGITTNAVAPGFVRSNPTTERQWQSYGEDGQKRLVESIHTRRLGAPEDIAQAVLFFASDDAAWISGQVLSVDGGRS